MLRGMDGRAGTSTAGSEGRLAALALQLTPGVGPVLGRRLLGMFGAEGVFGASVAALSRCEGVGVGRSRSIAESLGGARGRALEELERAGSAGVSVVSAGEAGYPSILAELPGAPLVLFVRGDLGASGGFGYGVAIVGSRRATAYGLEQASRFSAGLASAGLVVVSGGARGVDASAHRSALRVGGRTVVVVGCGLGHCYPPEHSGLYASVLEGGGALVSELPMSVPPRSEHFPKRNRIISGLSLGVLVIEAPAGSGALITARCAAEEHGREVMAVPGRVDAPASAGCLELVKRGEAALVTSPTDVLEVLESPARHLHGGTHGVRYGSPGGSEAEATGGDAAGLSAVPGVALTDEQRRVLLGLDEPGTLDDVIERTGLAAGAVQSAATLLELRRLVRRRGALLERL